MRHVDGATTAAAITRRRAVGTAGVATSAFAPAACAVVAVVGVAIVVGIVLVTRGGEEIAAYDGRYPDAAEQIFTIGCTATSGGQTDYCPCVLRHIEQELSYAEFEQLDRRMRTPGATVPTSSGTRRGACRPQPVRLTPSRAHGADRCDRARAP